MPSSFNLIEGFFKWKKELFFLELLDEEEHLFSVYDFFDFVTSSDCSENIDYFINHVEDEVIYSYNLINDIKDLSFSTEDSKEYVIGGVSFVKRGNEAHLIVIAGEIGDVKEQLKTILYDDDSKQVKSYLKKAPDRDKEIVKLLDNDDIWKINIYIRIDLERKTIDSRYVQQDCGDTFTTYTDDYGIFSSLGTPEEIARLIDEQRKAIQRYTAIFEVAYNFLHLPEYFDHYDDEITTEEHPTNLFHYTLKNKTKNDINLSSAYFKKSRNVWVLDRGVTSNKSERLKKFLYELLSVYGTHYSNICTYIRFQANHSDWESYLKNHFNNSFTSFSKTGKCFITMPHSISSDTVS